MQHEGRRLDGRAGDAHALPRGIDEVTPSWLTAVLTGDRPETGTVVDVEPVRIGTSHGLLGALWRLELTWSSGPDRPGRPAPRGRRPLPRTVVVKLPADGAASRAVATAMWMYPREVRFYGGLGPRTEAAVGCHHAAVDDATHDFVLVLADMSGATMVDQLGGCPPGRAAAVVDALAALHAPHWDEAGLDRADWLEPFDRSALATGIVDAVRRLWPDVRRHWRAEIGAEVAAIGDGMADRVHAAATALSRPPMTLVHGDVRLDNLFFDGDSVRMCDWQLTGRSRAARDLAYFLTQSLTPGVRAQEEDRLVRRYLDRLRGRGVAPGDESAFRADYGHGAVIGFAYGIVAAGGLDQPDDRTAAIPRSMLHRGARAMVDLGCVG